MTEALELRPDVRVVVELTFEFELPADLWELLGVGGRGELACRFSGFGDPM